MTLIFSSLLLRSLILCSITYVYLSIYLHIWQSIYPSMGINLPSIIQFDILPSCPQIQSLFRSPFQHFFQLSLTLYLIVLIFTINTLSPCPLIQSSLLYLPTPSFLFLPRSIVQSLNPSPPIFHYLSFFPSHFISIMFPLVFVMEQKNNFSLDLTLFIDQLLVSHCDPVLAGILNVSWWVIK